MIVGLTGGIGSGKTTVAQLFTDLGVPVYNSDIEAKKLMNSSKKLRKGIKSLFGKEAYKKKKLNRSFVAEKVFNDKKLLEELNSIVHPAVRKHFKSWVKEQTASYVIQEAAIIFEQESQDFYDKIVLVTAPEEERIARVLNRDPDQDRSKIKDRMANQLLDSEKIELADFVINNIDLKETQQKIIDVHNALLEYI